MKSIRFISILALTAGVAGCGGTNTPKNVAKLDAPTKQATKIPDNKTASLPERVADAPEETPEQKKLSVVENRIPSAPAPVSQAIEHEIIDIGTYASNDPSIAVKAALGEPVAYIENVPEVYDSTSLGAIGDFAASAPLPRGQMAPIRDDPLDTGFERRPATPYNIAALKASYQPSEALRIPAPAPRVSNAYTPAFGRQLAESALSRLNPNVAYVATYKKIGYPWGDVPENTGVCTDVVIRSFRGLGIDLQSMVHEDMRQAFSSYPSRKIYGLIKADPNIDHRRVVNLEAFFERVGASIPLGSDYQPGDIITWRLSGGEPHIGVVVNRIDPKTGNPLIVHNLGAGVRAEDLLDYAPPHGAYRFAPDQQSRIASLALKRS